MVPEQGCYCDYKLYKVHASCWQPYAQLKHHILATFVTQTGQSELIYTTA